MKPLKSIQNTSNSNNNSNHRGHEDLSHGSTRHKGLSTSMLLRLATRAMESLSTRSSSPTYHQGNGLEGSTKSKGVIQMSRCLATKDLELIGVRKPSRSQAPRVTNTPSGYGFTKWTRTDENDPLKLSHSLEPNPSRNHKDLSKGVGSTELGDRERFCPSLSE